jgi:hypothetical protein
LEEALTLAGGLDSLDLSAPPASSDDDMPDHGTNGSSSNSDDIAMTEIDLYFMVFENPFFFAASPDRLAPGYCLDQKEGYPFEIQISASRRVFAPLRPLGIRQRPDEVRNTTAAPF